MDLKAIVLDIDGTLLNDQKEISPRTRESLLKAQKAGVKVVLASGRPISAMERFSKELKMDQHHGLASILQRGLRDGLCNKRDIVQPKHVQRSW